MQLSQELEETKKALDRANSDGERATGGVTMDEINAMKARYETELRMQQQEITNAAQKLEGERMRAQLELRQAQE